MLTQRLCLSVLVASGALLAGCATPPPPDRSAEQPHCYKTNRGRVLACTKALVPSLNADAEAKRFAPDPDALTVYVVRRNWSDGRNLVTVQADHGPMVETLPDTMVRFKLQPGAHTIAFNFDGVRHSKPVEGKAGDVRFVRLDGMVWSWKSTYQWTDEPEEKLRERALKARLVADVVAR